MGGGKAEAGQRLRKSHLGTLAATEREIVSGQQAITWRNDETEKMWCDMRVEGGLIVRKINGQRRTDDTSGQTLMDSVPVGEWWQHRLSGSDLGLAVTGKGVITYTHTHTTRSLPICLWLCLALTQYYQSHHSSHVILLRGTNWTLSLQDGLGTQVIFYPSSHQRVRRRKKMREKQWRRGTRIYLHSPHVQNMLVQLPQAKGTMDAYTAPASASSYLQEFAVHKVLHEADLHKPHKAHRGHLLVWVHMVLPDLGHRNHHNDLLVVLLHLCMELKMEAHRDHCLPHMEHLVVGCFLLDIPPITDISKFFLQHYIYLIVTVPCRFRI